MSQINTFELWVRKPTPIENVFELAELLTAQSGGDGDCQIVADNYKELADLYDKWRMELSKYGKKRFGSWFYRDDDLWERKHVTFSDRSNESITFSPQSYWQGENIIYYE